MPTQAASSPRPILAFEADDAGDGVVRVRFRPSARDRPVAEGAWRRALRVAVLSAGQADHTLPDVAGTCVLEADGIRFVPHFPFVPGLCYRAVFDVGAVGLAGGPDTVSLEFALPGNDAASPPEVTAIFPSAGELPENLLRFYVLFSRAMRRGAVRSAVRLLDARGDVVPDALYRAPVELWDPEMRRLTVLLDPGRLKRGVGPNVALGPPLAPSRVYALEIGTAMTAIDGRHLPRAVTKRFRTTAAVRERVAIERWSLQAPRSGGHEPLVVGFAAPMDEALLGGGLGIAGPDGRSVAGRGVIGTDEMQWRFTPDAAWLPGPHRLAIGPSVEDVCGNGVSDAFDRPLRTVGPAESEPAGLSVAFAVD